MFKKTKFNLLKNDKHRPRIYQIHCGISPGKDVKDFTECVYYQKK